MKCKWCGSADHESDEPSEHCVDALGVTGICKLAIDKHEGLLEELQKCREKIAVLESQRQKCPKGHAYLANSHEYPCPWCEMEKFEALYDLERRTSLSLLKCMEIRKSEKEESYCFCLNEVLEPPRDKWVNGICQWCGRKVRE